MERIIFEVGETVRAVNNQPLPGNNKAPDLRVGKEYPILEIILDSQGFQHLDVGIPSELAYVRSYETKEDLERSDEIHWCHPSRFEKV